MLPPVLEIYVVWHPGDVAGEEIAREMVEHFHGTAFSGLIGGAIEVYVRSQGWEAEGGVPRPIPFPSTPVTDGIQHAQFVAIVPVLGTELANAVEASATAPWRSYVQVIADARAAHPNRVGVFPYLARRGAGDGALGQIMGPFQRIAVPADPAAEPLGSLRCRDLAQGIAQHLSGAGTRLTIFISHTKRASADEGDQVARLISAVRGVIQDTRLRDFFDASDLQPGENWDAELRAKAGTSAMLCLRTALYPSREWCQRETLLAKREGMPVVILDALGHREERGSFLMDHVPRVPVSVADDARVRSDTLVGLNLLVDECLKRALWRKQQELGATRPDLDIAWWAPHAPEPLTLLRWLEQQRQDGRFPVGRPNDLRILHPDPPLGPDERAVLQEMAKLSGLVGKLDIMTPRLLAARGG